MVSDLALRSIEWYEAHYGKHWWTSLMVDVVGCPCDIGDVVFFEFIWKTGNIPRRGRILSMNREKQRIVVLSNRDGGYMEIEDEPGTKEEIKNAIERNRFRRNYWLKLYLKKENCWQVIGGKDDRICDC